MRQLTINPRVFVENFNKKKVKYTCHAALKEIVPYVTANATSDPTLYRIISDPAYKMLWIFAASDWVQMCSHLGLDEHQGHTLFGNTFPNIRQPEIAEHSLSSIRFTNLRLHSGHPEMKDLATDKRYADGKLHLELGDERLSELDGTPQVLRSVVVKGMKLIDQGSDQYADSRNYVCVGYGTKGKPGGVAINVVQNGKECQVVLIAEVRPIPGDLFIETPRGFPSWVDQTPNETVLRELKEETNCEPISIDATGKKYLGYRDLALLYTDTGALVDTVQYGLVIGGSLNKTKAQDRLLSNGWQMATITVDAASFFRAVREPSSHKLYRKEIVYRKDGLFQCDVLKNGFYIEDAFTICAGNLALAKLHEFKNVPSFEGITQLCIELGI